MLYDLKSLELFQREKHFEIYEVNLRNDSQSSAVSNYQPSTLFDTPKSY